MEEVERWKAADTKAIAAYLASPAPDTVLALVAAELKKAEKLEGSVAKDQYTRLFEVSRDEDQAQEIAKALEKLGSKPDLVKHFNVITKWMLIGPFDSPMGAGFAKSFPPEEKVDLAAAYKGKADAEVKWIAHTTTKEDGKGTGLGLAICKRIVEQHHGKLGIESAVGKGTTLRVTLPVRPDTNVASLRTE